MKIIPCQARGSLATKVGWRAFTLLEVIISMAVFTLIMISVIGCWRCIISGKLAGEGAAKAAQQARIGIKTVEDALTCTEISAMNIQYYAFISDTSEKFASLSVAARLPSAFLGSGYFGDQVMRRVSFEVKTGSDGTNDLVMTQTQLLAAPDPDNTPYSITLARDVTVFMLEFWSQQDGDWVVSWDQTNALPPAVRVTLGVGHSADHPDVPYDYTVRTITIPSVTH